MPRAPSLTPPSLLAWLAVGCMHVRTAQDLGGAAPAEMMDLAALEARERPPGLGAAGRAKHPGDDLPDDHKVCTCPCVHACERG